MPVCKYGVLDLAIPLSEPSVHEETGADHGASMVGTWGRGRHLTQVSRCPGKYGFLEKRARLEKPANELGFFLGKFVYGFQMVHTLRFYVFFGLSVENHHIIENESLMCILVLFSIATEYNQILAESATAMPEPSLDFSGALVFFKNAPGHLTI